MKNINHNASDDQFSDKYALDPATVFDAADDERAFLKPFPVARRRQVAKVFWEPICMRGMFTPRGLLDFLRERQQPWQEHFHAACYTEADKAFYDQLRLAIFHDPMAVAYAAYMLEYVAHTMLPYLLSFHTEIKRELPPTKAQAAEFKTLGISGILGYNRRTAPEHIAEVKADHARQRWEWECQKAGE